MSSIAIHAEGISKRYTIGAQQAHYKSLRDTIAQTAFAPLRLFTHANRDADNATSRTHIWALKDVSFDVAHGEVLGIIGHNGSGKSTLLKILSRITRPTEGQATLHGRVGCLLEVGTGFHQELTGRENIYLNGAILGMKHREIQRKFDEIVGFSEVEPFIDTPVKFYSSGMYLRLAFAVAAHLETEILLVDEVLAVGDIAFQKKCLGKMSEVADAGRTVIFISHNMAAVTQLCSRIIWLDHGKIRASGQPDQLTAEYSRRPIEEAQPIKLENAARTGSGKVRFSSIRAVDEKAQDCNVFGMGESLTLELEAYSPIITRLHISVIIEDFFGRHILYAVSQDDNFESVPRNNLFHIRIIFPDLMLYPGDYNIAIACEYENEICDRIQNALSFHIEPRPVSGRLTPITTGKAVYFSPTKWSNIP